MSVTPADAHPLRLTINGRTVERTVSVRQPLIDFLREDLGLTGTHLGCGHGVCGACTVLIDGATARSCLMLAIQADGAEVTTVEGASDSGRLRHLQVAFLAHNAAQCGYCTAGMLLTAAEFLAETPHPDRGQIRQAISGNLCRCTGYQAIVDAIEAAAATSQATQ